ncbi:hypothetical protein THRCLA_00089 [Thraustotheca clavata]|uniref:EF-hand domain-containing protein n=1 Tax=Thraustotheca clavata TaxID=74557 RepID=A0A1W0ACD6_9STRA|nr:hypothetical protein THRCLA_00089 [Thraustotheca clavata]
MGLCASVPTITIPKYTTTEGMQALFYSLGFNTHDTNMLYSVFNRADADNSNGLSLHELLMFLDLDKTEFTKKTFNIMNIDGTGEIDFEEFVLAMWQFCLFTKEALISFSFGLYDEDSSGEIDTREAERFICEVWGDEWHHNQHAEAVNEKLNLMARSHDGVITQVEFIKFMHTHPILLFPAFQIQHEMVRRIEGESFWRRIEDQRLQHKKHHEPFLTHDVIMDRFKEYHNQTQFNGIEHTIVKPEEDPKASNTYEFKGSFRSKQTRFGTSSRYIKPTTIAVAPKPSIATNLRRKSEKLVKNFRPK